MGWGIFALRQSVNEAVDRAMRWAAGLDLNTWIVLGLLVCLAALGLAGMVIR